MHSAFACARSANPTAPPDRLGGVLWSWRFNLFNAKKARVFQSVKRAIVTGLTQFVTAAAFPKAPIRASSIGYMPSLTVRFHRYSAGLGRARSASAAASPEEGSYMGQIKTP
jgi:hypothetical protein